MGSSPWARGVIAGAAGGVAWTVGIMLFFGPAQYILANPDWQSAKMLAAFTTEPPPRAADAPWVVPTGLLVIGMLWGCAYVQVSAGWAAAQVRWWRRGVRFAVLAWILLVPWFVFFLPWNVLREPTALALLELLCWAGVMLFVGMTIAGVEQALRPRMPGSAPARTEHREIG